MIPPYPRTSKINLPSNISDYRKQVLAMMPLSQDTESAKTKMKSYSTRGWLPECRKPRCIEVKGGSGIGWLGIAPPHIWDFWQISQPPYADNFICIHFVRWLYVSHTKPNLKNLTVPDTQSFNTYWLFLPLMSIISKQNKKSMNCIFTQMVLRTVWKLSVKICHQAFCLGEWSIFLHFSS